MLVFSCMWGLYVGCAVKFDFWGGECAVSTLHAMKGCRILMYFPQRRHPERVSSICTSDERSRGVEGDADAGAC